MTPRRQAFFVRLGAVFIALIWAVVALREIINSSTFQVFGDYVAHVETSERVVALTFDDGPDPWRTPGVLDVLDGHGVKATFFMMGRNIERYPDTAREVLERGHQIGNHSYSHPKLVWMMPARVRDEIARTDHLIRGLGVTGDVYFRPPHAAKLLVLPYVLRQMGKLSVLADVDPEEWRGHRADILTARVLEQTRPGSIIGLHDPAGGETLQALKNIIPALRAQGYRFETMHGLVRHR